ncbi:ATPase [Rhodococcus sp. SRB_17]|nr:ATPase [Rhodococcus sp. SRB_17]
MTPATTISTNEISFIQEVPIGTALRVDTGTVWGIARDQTALTQVGIGTLIAIEGSTPAEYLIASLDRVTRDMSESPDSDSGNEDGEFTFNQVQRDLFRASLIGTYRTIDGVRRNTFKRGADSYPRLDSKCWTISGSNLQGLMSLIAQDVPEEQRLRIGEFVADRSATAIADGDRLFQRHAALVGSTGSGKSWCVALLLERAAELNHPNLIVLDIHGEYGPLTKLQGDISPISVGYHVAGPADIESPTENSIFLPYWLLNQEELLALVLDRSEDNAPNQAARFTKHIRELKEKTLKSVGGKEDVLKTFTVDSPVPFSIEDLVDLLEADDVGMVPSESTGKPVAGPFKGKLTRFISRLKAKIEDRRYAFLFQPPIALAEYDWLESFAKSLLSSQLGIKIVDFSEVPSDALPVVTGVFARFLYDLQFWMSPLDRTPVTIVCDEAHSYLPSHQTGVREQRALDAFERIAKEGRKYGISLLVVSQRPSDVSRTILSQCNNFIVLRLTNDQDQNVVSRLLPDNVTGFVSSLPLLDVGECILVGDSMVLPTRIRLDVPKVKPDSATRRFWSEWHTKPSNETAITSAVQSMRRQSRI